MDNLLEKITVAEFDHRIDEAIKVLDAAGVAIPDEHGGYDADGLRSVLEQSIKAFCTAEWLPDGGSERLV